MEESERKERHGISFKSRHKEVVSWYRQKMSAAMARIKTLESQQPRDGEHMEAKSAWCVPVRFTVCAGGFEDPTTAPECYDVEKRFTVKADTPQEAADAAEQAATEWADQVWNTQPQVDNLTWDLGQPQPGAC